MKPIIQLCKHVVAKVTFVPCSVNLTGKRDTVGHGEVTINNARIIKCILSCPNNPESGHFVFSMLMVIIACKQLLNIGFCVGPG